MIKKNMMCHVVGTAEAIFAIFPNLSNTERVLKNTIEQKNG